MNTWLKLQVARGEGGSWKKLYEYHPVLARIYRFTCFLKGTNQ